MADVTEICNLALSAVKAARIGSIDDATEEARSCKAVFDACRDRVLADHPWNFANRRAHLAAEQTAPAFDWSYQFALPGDPYCLKVRHVGLLDDPIDHAVEGRRLLCNSAGPLPVRFTARITEAAEYSPEYVDALGALLGWYLAPRLDKSRTLQSDLWDAYKEKLAEAKGADGQEGTPAQIYADDFLGARR